MVRKVGDLNEMERSLAQRLSNAYAIVEENREANKRTYKRGELFGDGASGHGIGYIPELLNELTVNMGHDMTNSRTRIPDTRILTAIEKVRENWNLPKVKPVKMEYTLEGMERYRGTMQPGNLFVKYGIHRSFIAEGKKAGRIKSEASGGKGRALNYNVGDVLDLWYEKKGGPEEAEPAVVEDQKPVDSEEALIDEFLGNGTAQPEEEPEGMTVAETAEALEMTERGVKNYISSGRLEKDGERITYESISGCAGRIRSLEKRERVENVLKDMGVIYDGD